MGVIVREEHKYKITELGEIPEEWTIFELQDIFHTIDGDRGKNYPNEKDFNKSGHCLFLDTKNVTKNGFNFDSKKYITKEKDELLRSGKLEVNDLVLTSRGTIGNIAWFEEKIPFKNLRINSAMLILRAKRKDLIYEFWYQLLKDKVVQDFIKKAKVGSAQPHITKKDLNKFKIAVPTIIEQQKIAEILSTVDEQIENTEQLIEKTKELKKGLMQRLLTKGIGHTKFKQTELGEIPEEWGTSSIGEHISDFKGGAAITPKDFTKSGLTVIPKKAIVSGGKAMLKRDLSYVDSTLANKFNRSIINNEYLITTLRDLVPSAPSLGYIVKIEDEEKYLMAQGVYGLKVKTTLNADFLIQLSNTKSYRKVIQSLKVGSTQVHMRNEDFLSITIPLPSLREQQKIASILSAVDEQITSYENEKEKYNELKKGLMQQLLTGKIRVTV